MRNNDKQLNTFSKRLKFTMEYRGTTQAELAREININPAAIQYLLASNAKSSRFTFELANALNVNSKWLATGIGTMLPENDPKEIYWSERILIPILSEKELIDLLNNNFDVNTHPNKQWESCNKNLGNNLYAYINTDNSMQPIFSKNSLLIFDYTCMLKNQAYVIAYIKSQNYLIFRKYNESNNKKLELLPINTEFYKKIEITDDIKIIGTVVESRTIHK